MDGAAGHFRPLPDPASAETGAEVRDNTSKGSFRSDHWQVNTAIGTVAGRYLIAADGAKGPMAKWRLQSANVAWLDLGG